MVTQRTQCADTEVGEDRAYAVTAVFGVLGFEFWVLSEPARATEARDSNRPIFGHKKAQESAKGTALCCGRGAPTPRIEMTPVGPQLAEAGSLPGSPTKVGPYRRGRGGPRRSGVRAPRPQFRFSAGSVIRQTSSLNSQLSALSSQLSDSFSRLFVANLPS